ncbi:hypothetical protein [Streptomyces sp. NPDC020607]|uniref:hypothetical protein n=1 Tax=Streptomyces sp. NPDC020607 TaxID=3365082 RepID=UPI0037B1365A
MQGTPHIAGTPHTARAAPVTRRPEAAAAPQLPVFIDESGWRRRALQGMALLVGCACLGYLLFVGALASGLRNPVGTHPPSTNGTSTSTGTHTGTSTDTATRTSAHHSDGDGGDRHRPPTGRSGRPPAGGAEQ